MVTANRIVLKRCINDLVLATKDLKKIDQKNNDKRYSQMFE